MNSTYIGATQDELLTVTEKYNLVKSKFDEWRKKQALSIQNSEISSIVVPIGLVSIPIIAYGLWKRKKR